MRSFLAGLRRLVIPWGASGDKPRIVIATDDPLAQAVAQDAAQSFYFSAGRGFVLSVAKADVAGLQGFLQLWATSPELGLVQFLDLDYNATPGQQESAIGLGQTVDRVLIGSNNKCRFLDIPIKNGADAATPGIIDIAHVADESLTDIRLYNRSLPRGTVTQAGDYAPSATFLNAETEIVRFNLTLKAGRAYRVELSGGHSNTAGTANQYRLRRGYVSSVSPGSDIGEFYRYTLAGNAQTDLTGIRYLRRAATAAITIPVSLTGITASGTGQLFATGTSPWMLTVSDVGSYAAHPYALEVV